MTKRPLLLATLILAMLGCATPAIPATPATPIAHSIDLSHVHASYHVHDGVAVFTYVGPLRGGSLEAFNFALDVASRDPFVHSIEVRLDSPGGYVAAGISIAEAIASVNKPLTCVVIGQASSAAYFVLQHCPVRVMQPNAKLMMHRAHSTVEGNAHDALEAAMRLAKIDSVLAAGNCKRLTITQEECRAKYDTAEWWLDATDAMLFGAIDYVEQ